MNNLAGFIKKEFIHILRDPRTLIILFGLPVVQILIFGFVIRNEIQDVKIAILDYSKDDVTREITNKILSSGFFVLSENLTENNDIEEIFREGKIREVVIFESQFARKLEREGKASVQVLADASDPNSASLVVNYTRGIIFDYLKKASKEAAQPLKINAEVRMMYNPGLKSAFMFVPGTMALILMLVSAMMTSISIAREKETGTMEVLLVSPLRPIHIIVGKVTPYILLSCINAVVIIALGYFVFGLPVKGSLVLLLAETVLFISLALSLGILISTMASNQQVAMFLSVFVLMLPTILLSGFIFPIENMPKILQWVTFIVPPRYFIEILRSIMLKGTGFFNIWQQTTVLIGMTLFFIILSAVKFKTRLE
ncbi:MAG: ABC transporter permease [Bacteroidales bacterium]|nr:ABC transporter permease [Bacteroidales bacterium]